MDTKALSGVTVKDADKGQVEAVFSRFNVIDKDGDVTLPGAFEDGAEVDISAYGHKVWDGALPVGNGVIRVKGDEAILQGQFYMDTTGGRDTFAVVKAKGPRQQWSYGYDAEDTYRGDFGGKSVRFLPKQLVHEVSPVQLGAGLNTRTLTTKSGLKYADEATAVVTALAALIERTEDVVTLRAKEGKGLGDSSRALLADVQAHLKALSVLLAEHPSDDGALEREWLRYMAASSHLKELTA